MSVSQFVPLDHWAYSAIDRLSALGYVPAAFLGVRPWTRWEIARILDESNDDTRMDMERDDVRTIYDRLVEEFSEDLSRLHGGRWRALRVHSIEARSTTIAGDPLTDGYHFGETLPNQQGRRYARGASGQAGFAAEWSLRRFGVFVQGEYQHSPQVNPLAADVRSEIARMDLLPVRPATTHPPGNRFRLMDAYVAFYLKNWQISFGKQSLSWTLNQGGALNFGNNAAPIPMLRISRSKPVLLPSFLSWLGPIKTELFFGRLEGHQFILGPEGIMGAPSATLKHQPFLQGQKFSFKPTRNLEFGVTRTSILGGEGFPLTARRIANSFFSFSNSPDPDLDPGDRRSGFEFRYRVPRLRDWLIVYADAMAEDEISPIGYPRRSAISPGIYLPQLPGVRKLDLRAEGVYTDLPGLRLSGIFYSNIVYRDGFTNAGQLLGHWVGRQGSGYQLWSTYWAAADKTIRLGFRSAEMSKQFVTGGGDLKDMNLSVQWQWSRSFSSASLLQYEWWSLPGMSLGKNSNVAASITVTMKPEMIIKKK